MEQEQAENNPFIFTAQQQQEIADLIERNNTPEVLRARPPEVIVDQAFTAADFGFTEGTTTALRDDDNDEDATPEDGNDEDDGPANPDRPDMDHGISGELIYWIDRNLGDNPVFWSAFRVSHTHPVVHTALSALGISPPVTDNRDEFVSQLVAIFVAKNEERERAERERVALEAAEREANMERLRNEVSSAGGVFHDQSRRSRYDFKEAIVRFAETQDLRIIACILSLISVKHTNSPALPFRGLISRYPAELGMTVSFPRGSGNVVEDAQVATDIKLDRIVTVSNDLGFGTLDRQCIFSVYRPDRLIPVGPDQEITRDGVVRFVEELVELELSDSVGVGQLVPVSYSTIHLQFRRPVEAHSESDSFYDCTSVTFGWNPRELDGGRISDPDVQETAADSLLATMCYMILSRQASPRLSEEAVRSITELL